MNHGDEYEHCKKVATEWLSEVTLVRGLFEFHRDRLTELLLSERHSAAAGVWGEPIETKADNERGLP